MRREILLLLSLGLLAGCVSFGAKPPPILLTLSAPDVPDVRAENPVPVAVFEPLSPRKLASLRVPVQVDATSIAYIKDAQWVDAPRRMFARLLTDRMAADPGLLPLDPAQVAVDGARRLTGELVDFGADARTGDAVVTYDAILTRPGDGAIMRRRFTARVPVGKIGAKTIAVPLDRAAQSVAADVVAWVKAN